MPNHRTIVALVCVQCGASFERGVWHPSQAPKHCSQVCVSAARRAAPLPLRSERATVPCAGCGNPVTRTLAHLAADERRGSKPYCSRSCAASTIHTGLSKPKSREQALKLAASNRGRTPWNKKSEVVKACENCGARLEMAPCKAERTRFCSKACKHAQRRTVTGPAHWLFTREQRPCEMCGLIVWVKRVHLSRFRFCSRRCSGAWVSNTWPRTSSLETALQIELSARGIDFKAEYAIGPYSVDLAFPDARVVVEADGTYWHGSDRQKAKDRRKDGYLGANGWAVVRFTEVAIKASPAACIDEIMPLLASRTDRPPGQMSDDNSGDRSVAAGC